jgi:hypothetical protein
MGKTLDQFIYWMPRATSIGFILFLTLFSLDVFDGSLGFWQTILAFLIHNIPSFVLLAVVLVAWKYDLVGAIGFILAGFAYIILLATSQNFQWFMLSWSFIISGPAFVTGFLFYLNWKNKRNNKNKSKSRK